MDNFMYNVMANGIGGVNCGGIEGDCEIRDSIRGIGVKIKIHDVLIDGAYVEEAVELGYLKIVNPFEYASAAEVDKLNCAKNKRRREISRKVSIIKKEIANYKSKRTGDSMPSNIRIPKEKKIEVLLEELKSLKLLKKRKTQYSVTKLGVEKYGSLAETGMLEMTLKKKGVTGIEEVH